MLDEVETRLREAADVGGACRAAASGIAAARRELRPAVYLERGGRLRCMAVEGREEVRDGLAPAGGGAAGHTVPLHVRGRVAGMLDVVAPGPLDDADAALVAQAAAALAARIDALGGPPPETAAERLARHAVRLAGLHAPGQIEAEALAAALDVSGLGSALLLEVRSDGRAEPHASTGPLGPALAGAPRPALAAIAAAVRAGASWYTVRPEAVTVPGARTLAAFGAPVADHLAVLVLADGRPIRLDSERVEVLELLAAHVASCLRTAVAVRELRERAATDPLTGLGHHATFHAVLAAARPPERPAVLLCDVDGFKRFNDTHGHQAGDRVLRTVATALADAVRRSDSVFRVGGDEFAALVRVADRAEALDAGERLRAAVAAAAPGVTISVGVAVPVPGEPESAVLDRADRALYAVKDDGRDGVRLAADEPTGQQALPV